ncbi:hypothetical protein CRI93_11420 [Longimonas halophila]|uniref:Uncharacterized protein n=1 Tax=Longimonas halophila TaxID=1469170 RepID=A0A2H3NJU9_9BACT|nr:hypothetical protein [Longimonas halophila]PEN06080.1 hypothetical protein CRI93_11420 [Longimonas halophila]
MPATTNFDEWLDDAGPQGYQEIWELAQAVKSGGNYGRFAGKGANDKTVVTAGSGHEALIIASPEARSRFLEMVRDRYCNEMTIEGYYEFNRQLEQDD